MLTDTHTHLYLPDFKPDREGVVRRAIDAGVGMMVFPNVDGTTVAPLLELAGKFPDNIRVAMGLHPTEVRENWREQLAGIPVNLPEIVAVGEIGMDLYWDKTYITQQREAFRTQCEIAVERNLPVIIHQRDALEETLEVLDSLPKDSLSGVFHSFGGTVEDVERIRRTGDFYFGINGIVTFKNSRLRDVLPEIGADRLLLETDSPYLTPVPFRGRRNESAYIVHVAAYVGQVLGIPLEEVAEITARNAAKLFKY